MGASRKRKKKRSARGKRKLGSRRLAAIDRIERAKKRSGASPAAGATEAPARPAPTVRTDPAAAERIAEARRVGLSVADDTSAERVEQLMQRFELAAAYVRDVWAALAPAGPGPSDDELRRVAAGLFSDGRLADGIVAAQQQRQAKAAGPIARDAHFRVVAKALRERFGDRLPARSLWSRLLGR